MESNNTISFELSEKISNMIVRNYGLGRIFNHLRELKSCDQITGLGILRLAICELKNANKIPSKSKIGHHFRTKVDKNDWDGASKTEILEDLYNP